MNKEYPNNNNISSNMNVVLKLLRTTNEMTSSALAEKLNVTQAYISSIESGKRRVTDEILTKYSKVFKVPRQTLLFFDDTSNSMKLKTQEILILMLSKINKSQKIKCDVTITKESEDQ